MQSAVFSSRLGLLLCLLVFTLTAPVPRAQAPVLLGEVSVYPNPAHIWATMVVPAVPGAARATVELLDT